MAAEKKRKIVPPVYLFISLVLMWVLNRYVPLNHYVQEPLVYIGVVPVLSGIAMAAIAAGMFTKAETGLVPFEEATTLITSGLFRYTRNPMYLGMFLVLFGVAFMMGSISALIPPLLFIVVIRYNFVAGEERFMEAAFGQQYLDYKSSVRRWI